MYIEECWNFDKNIAKYLRSFHATVNMHFSTFTHVRQIYLLITFVMHFKKNFFNGFQISMKFWVFLIPHNNTFSNFVAKRAKNGSKNQKTYLVNFVLDFNIAPTTGHGFFIL
jgi:hypothetical protein